ncbi:SCO family protein [Cohnella nanjingensis]|uniref:SCO family protein n=1 Tax=Cohnella nanjingensis TaxID=1387779 RepID=A0A7X0RNT5_9BACL|nr:SCO family protein [Cohnella nanjingensis]MBB6670907.1 SCO family protein [Cohnella nanjingensis]
MEQENQTSAPDAGAKPASKPFARRYGFPIAVLVLCVILGGYLLWSQKSGSKLPDLGAAPDFTYQDIDGKTVKMSDLNGKVRLVYFFYTNCPDVCPPTTFMLSQVQEKLKADGQFGSDVEIVSVTIDPQRDTPEVLRKFGDKFKADYAGWRFLRGDEAATADLAKKYGLLAVKGEDGFFSHANLIVLVDKKGRMRDQIIPESSGIPDTADADDVYASVKSLL